MVQINYDAVQIVRKLSKLPSLDDALGAENSKGLPYCSYEVYGSPNTGKSSFVYFLSGLLANGVGDVVVTDFEKLDPAYLEKAFTLSGFSGTVKIVSPVKDEKGKRLPRKHWEMLEELLDLWASDDYAVAIFDSVGAYVPTSIMDGTIEEANIGVRARAVAAFMRKATAILQTATKPKALFVTNHVHQVISGYGSQTSGGVTLSYLAQVRISLRQLESIVDEDTKRLQAYVVKGSVEKLRYGGRGGVFVFALIPNLGVHYSLSLLFDLINRGVLERSRTVKFKDKSLGYLSHFIDAALQGNEAAFESIHEIYKEVFENVQNQ